MILQFREPWRPQKESTATLTASDAEADVGIKRKRGGSIP